MNTPCEPFNGIPHDQEPEVMPGFEAHPFTSAPWPPLSREQVVELHDALIAWRRAEERVGPHTRAEHNMRNPGNVDDHLLDVLERLGIGAPPKRSWEQVMLGLEPKDGQFVMAAPQYPAPTGSKLGYGQRVLSATMARVDTIVLNARMGGDPPHAAPPPKVADPAKAGAALTRMGLASSPLGRQVTDGSSYLMPKEQGLGDPGVVEAMRAKWERMVKSPAIGKSLLPDEAPPVRPPLGFAELTLPDDDPPTVDR